MALWENNKDIAEDLDALSGFKTTQRSVKSYTSWGRGKNLEDANIPDVPFSENKNQEEFHWFKQRQIGKFPDSLSRGKKLEILKENCKYKGKESEVREQLRVAMGPGYSNELIEATFKRRMDHIGVTDNRVSSGKQFEDSEIQISETPENTLKTVAMPSDNITETDTSVNKKSKRKPRRYRNAVLESLERMNNSGESGNINFDALLSKNSSQIVGPIGTSTVKNIPPACYVPYKRKTNSFEYADIDFPKL